MFLELLRDISGDPVLQSVRARHFGTFEAFEKVAGDLDYPAVLKGAAGDSGRAVRLARTPKEALSAARALSWTPAPRSLWRTLIRRAIVPGLTPDSCWARSSSCASARSP